MGPKTLGQDGGLAPGLRTSCPAEKLFLRSFEAAVKRIGRDLFSLVDDLENRLQSIEDPLALVGDDFVVRFRDKTRFANQVG